MIVVGEIGISPRDFWQMEWWQLCSVIRGYARRQRHLWSATRWHAYNVMAAMPYTDLRKAGISSAQDLLKFPWEQQPRPPVSDEEIKEMQNMLRAMRRQQQ